MSAKMEQFRVFVSKHPLLKEEVRNNKFTWQNVYEEWVLYGEEDDSWKKYEQEKEIQEESIQNNQTPDKDSVSTVNLDSIKSIMGYVQKINPDSLNKTLNTVQKILQITEGIGGKGRTGFFNGNYNSWWD